MAVAEVSIITFVAGFILGTIVKGVIDRKFERVVQKTLIEVGQMADDEIEQKDKTIKEKEIEIERLSSLVNELQIKRAIKRLHTLEDIDI